jgi:hypothetical protein
MIVINPVTVTDSILASSNAPETDYAEWNPATSYVALDRVIRLTTHRIYENLIPGVNATLPENALTGATPRWLDIGSTNRWAMFDNEINSNTVLTSPLTVILAPGSIDTVSLIDITADAVSVVLRDTPSGTIIYDVTRTDLDSAQILDIFDFFIAPPQLKKIINFTGLPVSYTDCELTVTVTGSTVSVGALKFGQALDIGSAEYGVGIGIVDYSRVETNEFGRVTAIPRNSSKTMNVKLFVDNGGIGGVYNLLDNVKTIPCVWIGVEDDPQLEESLTVFGIYKDFNITVQYPQYSYCDLQIQGYI